MKSDVFTTKLLEELKGMGEWNQSEPTRITLPSTVSIKVYDDGLVGFMWWETNWLGFGCWELWGLNPLISIDDESAMGLVKAEIARIRKAIKCKNKYA